MKKFFIYAVTAIILIAAVLFVTWTILKSGDTAPVFSRDHIVIQRADGQKFPFDVEVAATHAQQEYGLMHRHLLPDNAGMLFIYDPPDEIGMWMKDTPLPLDMLFVRADGLIEKIAANTVPFSVEAISSDEPVKGVIELNAGTAARLGLQVGDRLIYPGFR